MDYKRSRLGRPGRAGGAETRAGGEVQVEIPGQDREQFLRGGERALFGAAVAGPDGELAIENRGAAPGGRPRDHQVVAKMRLRVRVAVPIADLEVRCGRRVRVEDAHVQPRAVEEHLLGELFAPTYQPAAVVR